MDLNPSEIATILATCSGGMPLQYLTFRLESTLSFADSIFRHSTHLEVFYALIEHDWTQLRLIPRLTHFAFASVPLSEILGPFLLACTRLECFVFPTGATSLEETDAIAARFPDDVRFVVTREELDLFIDWERGARTGQDFWGRAEALLAAKRAAKVASDLIRLIASISMTTGNPELLTRSKMMNMTGPGSGLAARGLAGVRSNILPFTLSSIYPSVSVLIVIAHRDDQAMSGTRWRHDIGWAPEAS
ncbi:hypothetical protein DFH09DRAFT_1275182 [Mycena vulgaris]|nr:hypothetical protein DFH09DRAFT_1275182 [Mycena vulgaris]